MTNFADFYKKWQGKPCEVEDPTNIFQCYDLCFAYCDFINIPRSAIRHLNAFQIWTQPNDETIKYFEMIPNTPNGVPQVGDIVIFSTLVGPAGHFSLANGTGDSNSFVSFEQNWAGKKFATLVTHQYEGVLGWLRLRDQPNEPGLPVITDQTRIPQIEPSCFPTATPLT